MKIYIAIILSILMGACSMKSHPDAQAMNESSSIQYQFAYQFYSRGELIRALGAILEAKKISANNPEILNLLGLIYFRQKKYPHAEKAFRQAIEIDPKGSEVYNNLGTLYYEQKEYKKAKQSFEQALENPLYLHPDRVYNNLALVYKDMGQFEEAQSNFQKAISVNENYYLPYNNMARLLMDHGKMKQAKVYLKNAIRLCKTCAEPRYRMASVLLKESKKAEAIKMFQKVYDLDPKGYYGQLGRKFLLDAGKLKDDD